MSLPHFSPFLGAVIIGWILSVCFHEFSHALVAYWGGDRSVRERGYFDFNPLNYLDPMMSLLLPAVILLFGGMPLPGGAVLIDRSSLRGRGWMSAVSAAGPAANLLLFAVLAVVLHPKVGIVDPADPNPSNFVRFLGVMAVLQIFSVLINLIPMPPLDGFGIIEPYLDYETRVRMRQPAVAYIGLFVLFFVVFRIDAVGDVFFQTMFRITDAVGLDRELLYGNYNLAFFGT